jgi:hypothetical protein
MTLDANDIARACGFDGLRKAWDAAPISQIRQTKAEAPAQIDGSGLVVKCAADIKPEKVDWLWQDRLPLGKCTLTAGEGGLGKSMALAWIAARVSQGGEWPCGEGLSPCGSVIVLSAEAAHGCRG